MVEQVFAENIFGTKSFYDLDVISKSNDKKEIVVKTWNGIMKKMMLDEKINCYKVVEEKKG